MIRYWAYSDEEGHYQRGVTADEILNDTAWAVEDLTHEQLHSLRMLLDLAVNNAPTIGCSKEWWEEIRRKVSAVLRFSPFDHAHLIGHNCH